MVINMHSPGLPNRTILVLRIGKMNCKGACLCTLQLNTIFIHKNSGVNKLL